MLQDSTRKWRHFCATSFFHTLHSNPSVISLGPNFCSRPIGFLGFEVSLVLDPSVNLPYSCWLVMGQISLSLSLYLPLNYTCGWQTPWSYPSSLFMDKFEHLWYYMYPRILKSRCSNILVIVCHIFSIV